MGHALALLNIGDFTLKMNIASTGGAMHSHVIGTLPAKLLGLFDAAAQTAPDGINDMLAGSSLPVAWQIAQLCGRNAGPLYPHLNAHGIHHGLSMAVQNKKAGSRIDFYGTVDSPPFPTAVCADLHFLGLHLHEAAQLLWHKTAPDQAPLLSVREHECLDWSAHGKTSREIGLILGITQRTVYFHLNNAAKKLNVYGTRHAISRSIMLGIMQPHK
jgi:LuxR family transcriptional regulator